MLKLRRTGKAQNITHNAGVSHEEHSVDTFDGAKPRFLNRGKKRRSVSTLSIPRASDRGVEWVAMKI